MKQSTLMLAAALVLCGCGKADNNANNTNNAVNNTSNTPNNSNNTSNTPNNTNNTSNATNNTTSTNNGTSGTNNNTTPYTPYEFTCDDVTPVGMLDDLVGTWTTNAGCIGTDPYEPLYMICDGAVIPRFEITRTDGFLVVNPDYSYVNSANFEIGADVWLPGECTAQIGGGDCPTVATTLLALFEAAGAEGTIDCADDAGGCLCDVVGSAPVRAIGVASSTGDGLLTLDEFDSDGAATQEEWRFNLNGDDAAAQSIADGTSYGSTRGGQPSACEIYCAGFMANCNDVDGLTAYDDEADCLTQCAGFTVAGSEQTSGDSLECRTYHLFVSADTSDVGNRDLHCPHAQATATAPCAN